MKFEEMNNLELVELTGGMGQIAREAGKMILSDIAITSLKKATTNIANGFKNNYGKGLCPATAKLIDGASKNYSGRLRTRP